MSYLISKTNEYFQQHNLAAKTAKQDALTLIQNVRALAEKERRKIASEKAKVEQSSANEVLPALQKVKAEKERALQAEKDRGERELQQLAGKKKQAELDLQARRRNCLNDYLRQVKQSAVLLPPFSTKTTDKWLTLDDKEIPSWDIVKQQQNSRICLPTLLLGEMTAGGTTLPLYIPWQENGHEKRANLYIRYTNDAEEEVASNLHNAVITRILAAFPVGKVHLTFINTNANSYGNKWLWSKMTENEYIKKAGNKDLITERLTNVMLNGQSEFTEMENAHNQLKRLKQHVIDVQKLFVPPVRTLVQHNRQKECIEQAYEVVVLYDPFKGQTNTSYMETLSWLISEGYKGGIHFVILQNDANNSLKGDENQPKEAQLLKTLKEQSYIIDCSRDHCTLDNGKAFISTAESDAPCDLFPSVDRLLKQYSLVNACFEDMDRTLLSELRKGEIKAEEARKIAQQKAKEARKAPVAQWRADDYAPLGCDELNVPIGIDSTGAVQNFVLNDQHAHSCIVGQTGSGKSILLEDIIVSLTMRYSPADLQLYLIDFKNGATFKYYAHLPHTRWCVATEDKAILYMMLNEVDQERDRRERLNSRKGLPHIVIIFDEFSGFFQQSDSDTASGDKDRLQGLINKYLERIAKMGRSSKIHLVMASQNLDQVSNVDELIKQSKRNPYVFNGEIESRLLDDKVGEVSNYLKQESHYRYCAHPVGDEMQFIHPYLLDIWTDEDRDTQKTEKLVASIADKANKLWGGQATESCVFLKYKTPEAYDYRPASYIKPYAVELGTDIFGSIVGIGDEDVKGCNTLVYGDFNDASREITMRVMLSLMRAPLWRFGNNQQTYVVNMWDKGENSSGQGTKALYNLQKKGLVHLYKDTAEDVGALLLCLLDEFNRRKDMPSDSPIYLYVCNYTEDCQLANKDYIMLSSDVVVPIQSDDSDDRAYESNANEEFLTNHEEDVSRQKREICCSDVMNVLLEKGVERNIFVIVNVTDEYSQLQTKYFQYSIFQRCEFMQNGSKTYNGMFGIDKLSNEPQKAQVIFYDKSKEEEKKARLVVPFRLPNE